jgi:hypothetical protein
MPPKEKNKGVIPVRVTSALFMANGMSFTYSFQRGNRSGNCE